MYKANKFIWRMTLLAGIVMAIGASSVPTYAMTLQEEIDLGKKIDQQILKETSLSEDEVALKEMETYGGRLLKGASMKRPQLEYHFRIIQQDDFNAFSTPGGYVYFTERIWNVLRPDERIGVLAHEIVHADRRHAIDALSKAQTRGFVIAVLLTVLKAGRTVGDIADIAHQLYTLKYSRGAEQQADTTGVDLTREAGYNPAGLLLAMRKIQRFQNEKGGQPPKIFSSHPPTKERLQYLQACLTKLGVPIPPEDIKDVANPYKIGEVTGVSNDMIDFPSSMRLQKGASIWVMTTGWDSHYENRAAVPVARGNVITVGTVNKAQVSIMPGADAKAVVKGAGIYAPPEPKSESGVAKFAAPSPGTNTLKLVSEAPLKKLDRLFARQVVWNKDNTQLVYDNASYVIVTDPSNPTGYVALGRPKYAYAPTGPGVVFVKVGDTEAKRWAGIVVSIGRGGGTLELLPTASRTQLARDLNNGTKFDVCSPAWDPKQPYKNRVVGKAVLESIDAKIVLQISSYSPGWSIDGIEVGFDMYEAIKEAEGKKND